LGDEFMVNNEIEYLEYEGNRFFVDEGVLKDVQVESEIVKIPEIVTEIRRQAFLDAKLEGKMEELFVPSSVKKIERLSFAGMAHLRRVELLGSVVTLEQGVFRNCMELETILMPNTLRGIESRAFENCLKLTQVQLPPARVEIAEDAFLNCVCLNSRRIEKAVTEAAQKKKDEIEEMRRAKFPHLYRNTEPEEEKLPEPEPVLQDESEVLKETAAPEKQETIKPAVFPQFEKSAAEELLEAELLAEQMLQQTMQQSVPQPAPQKAPEAQFCIRDGVLERCEVLTDSIRIPEGVTALADRVFYGQKDLSHIEFPTTLSYIGAQALEGTGWLEREREKSNYVIVNGILVSAFYNSMVIEAKLPDTVYRIAPYAFYRSEAKLVVLSESVREVDARAFIESEVEEIDFSPRADVILHTPLAMRCNKLRELYFQGKVERLDENFTEDCPALKRVCLKWAQTVVSKQAFPENVRIWVL